MHRLIAEQAGHQAVAEAMRYVDHSPEPSLERLDAERRAEARASPLGWAGVRHVAEPGEGGPLDAVISLRASRSRSGPTPS